MKSFLGKLLIFVILLVAADVSVGWVSEALRMKAPSGRTVKFRYIMDEMNVQMLMMGSSRCNHHYDTALISNGTGLTCYNTGDDGNGIIMSYGFYKAACERNIPRVVMCELHAPFDCDVNDNVRYLSNLRPFFFRAGIREIFEKVDSTEAIKCLSSLYRFNGKLMGLINDNLGGEPFIEGGYVPLKKTMLKAAQNAPAEAYVPKPVDEVKLYFLEALCKECAANGTVLVFARSPIYNGATKEEIAPAMAIAEKYGVPFMDYANDVRFVRHPEFFADRGHMNQNGAEAYSRIFANDLKRILEVKNVLGAAALD